MVTKITTEQALEALESLDDCARMDLGVDAKGPRSVLEQYIAQTALVTAESLSATVGKPVVLHEPSEVERLATTMANGGLPLLAQMLQSYAALLRVAV